jgi:hypothetical protein
MSVHSPLSQYLQGKADKSASSFIKKTHGGGTEGPEGAQKTARAFMGMKGDEWNEVWELYKEWDQCIGAARASDETLGQALLHPLAREAKSAADHAFDVLPQLMVAQCNSYWSEPKSAWVMAIRISEAENDMRSMGLSPEHAAALMASSFSRSALEFFNAALTPGSEMAYQQVRGGLSARLSNSEGYESEMAKGIIKMGCLEFPVEWGSNAVLAEVALGGFGAMSQIKYFSLDDLEHCDPLRSGANAPRCVDKACYTLRRLDQLWDYSEPARMPKRHAKAVLKLCDLAEAAMKVVEQQNNLQPNKKMEMYFITDSLTYKNIKEVALVAMGQDVENKFYERPSKSARPRA